MGLKGGEAKMDNDHILTETSNDGTATVTLQTVRAMVTDQRRS